MNTIPQRFRNNLPTRTTHLGSILWINQYHLTTSFGRFAVEDCDELAPASIADPARQSAVAYHFFNAERFRSNDAKSVNQ